MMRHQHHASDGFTAVELLITLFVAAAFLVAGYQLFNVVIKDGGATRAESSAGNVAYNYLRQYSDSATNPCTNLSPLANEPVTLDGLDNLDATISITITCPQTDAPTISKVEATVNYGLGTDASEVKYATYIDKSRGATPNTDVTSGLIDWWKLNGSMESSGGPTTLVNDGSTSIAGQNGNPIGAYAFTDSTSALRADNYSARMVGLSAFTVTGWVYPANNPGSHDGFFGFRDDSTGAVYAMQLSGTNTVECRVRINGSTYYQPSASGIVVTPNTWQLISIVYNGANLTCYVNTTASATVAATWSTMTTSTIPFSIGRTAQYGMTGRVDDVRIYNRALSGSEITQLVNGGAK